MLRACLLVVVAGTASSVSALTLPPPESLSLVSPSEFEEEVALLETATEGFSTSYCGSYGDTHVHPFVGGGFNVMGSREWVLVEGPTDALTPKFFYQGTQLTWQNCGRSNAHITVLQDVGIRCGNAFLLVDQPGIVYNCRNRWSGDANPKLYVYGKETRTKVMYDGSDDLISNAAFAQGKWIYLDAGNGFEMKVNMRRNYCTNKRCTISHATDRYIDVQVSCADVTSYIQGRWVSGWYGGRFTDAIIYAPRNSATSPIRTGTYSNMEGGYCKGWASSLEKSLESQHLACRRLRPQAFYSSNMNNPPQCVATFTTKKENSVFAFFEKTSNGKYDSKWTTEESRASATTQLMEQQIAGCAMLLSQFTNKLSYKAIPTNSWDEVTKNVVEGCAEDMAAGMTWDKDEMTSHMCAIANTNVQQERRDIFCAAKLFSDKCTATKPAAMVDRLADAKSDDDIKLLRGTLGESRTTSEEIQSSLDNIIYWNIDECATKIEASSDLDDTDCKDYTFVDTAKATIDPNSKTWLGRVTAADHSGQIIRDTTVFDTDKAIVLLGPPTFRGSNPAVGRIQARVDGWNFFVAEPRCFDRWHVREYMPYLIFSSPAGTPDFTIVTAQVDGNWVDVLYPPMEGEILAFATIATSENGACGRDCVVDKTGTRGYVFPRIRNISKSKLQIALFSDTTKGKTLQKETVNIVLVTKREGELGGKKWITGTFETAATSVRGNYKTAPNSVFTVPLQKLDKNPHIFLQVITFNDAKEMSLRTKSATKTRLEFMVDSDGCDRQLRTHGKETVAYLAIEM